MKILGAILKKQLRSIICKMAIVLLITIMLTVMMKMIGYSYYQKTKDYNSVGYDYCLFSSAEEYETNVTYCNGDYEFHYMGKVLPLDVYMQNKNFNDVEYFSSLLVETLADNEIALPQSISKKYDIAQDKTNHIYRKEESLCQDQKNVEEYVVCHNTQNLSRLITIKMKNLLFWQLMNMKQFV